MQVLETRRRDLSFLNKSFLYLTFWAVRLSKIGSERKLQGGPTSLDMSKMFGSEASNDYKKKHTLWVLMWSEIQKTHTVGPYVVINSENYI